MNQHTTHRRVYLVDHDKDTPKRKPRTVAEFLSEGAKPTNDLPPGVVRLSDLINDFFKTQQKNNA